MRVLALAFSLLIARVCPVFSITYSAKSGSGKGMKIMRDDETSITYYAARKMRMVQKVKNAWKKEVTKRRVSRHTLAMCLKDWRKGDHELIVDKDIIVKDWF
jgi:hypothetical protein